MNRKIKKESGNNNDDSERRGKDNLIKGSLVVVKTFKVKSGGFEILGHRLQKRERD